MAEYFVETQWLARGTANADHHQTGHEGVGQYRDHQSADDLAGDHHTHTVFSAGQAEQGCTHAKDEGNDEHGDVEDDETAEDDALGAFEQAPGLTDQAADAEVITTAERFFDARYLAVVLFLQGAAGGGVGVLREGVAHDDHPWLREACMLVAACRRRQVLFTGLCIRSGLGAGYAAC